MIMTELAPDIICIGDRLCLDRSHWDYKAIIVSDLNRDLPDALTFLWRYLELYEPGDITSAEFNANKSYKYYMLARARLLAVSFEDDPIEFYQLPFVSRIEFKPEYDRKRPGGKIEKHIYDFSEYSKLRIVTGFMTNSQNKEFLVDFFSRILKEKLTEKGIEAISNSYQGVTEE